MRPPALFPLPYRFALRLADGEMGGVAGALDRMRVNLTLEVEGGMWMHAEPRYAEVQGFDFLLW